jgi:hypothetical protein
MGPRVREDERDGICCYHAVLRPRSKSSPPPAGRRRGRDGVAVSRAAWVYCPACDLRACKSASLRKLITATLLVRE